MILKQYLGGKSGRMKRVCTRCDHCGIFYSERLVDNRDRKRGKLCNGLDICKGCTRKLSVINLVKHGTIALTTFSTEEKAKHTSNAGKISAAKYNPKINKSRFSTERWEAMSKEDQHTQVMKANEGLQVKLKDPTYASNHFKKVLRHQTSIGYTSKAHKELHECIEPYGFKTHVMISSMEVDECNEELKIVVEYNGDYWHCNPYFWKEWDYNKSIKMFAKEKWSEDLRRRKVLEKLGYTVLVVWENGWNKQKDRYINRIKEAFTAAKNTNN